MFCVFVLIGGKCFVDRIWVKNKNGLFNSDSFKLNVEILKLLFTLILSYYSWRVFVCQSLFYFNAMYLLVTWSWKYLKWIVDWTTWKVSLLGVFLVRTFPHADWTRRDRSISLYLSNKQTNKQPKCGKIRTRKTPNTDTFHAVLGFSVSSQ